MSGGTFRAWVSTLGTGLLTGVAGLFLMGYLATWFVDWFRISSFEGGAGYYVALLGLVGGVAGFVVGVIGSRVVVREAKANFWKGLGLSLGAAVGLTGIVGGLGWLAADHPPMIDGKHLALDVEVRTPVGYQKPAKSEYFTPSWAVLRYGSQKSGGYGSFDLAQARLENERWIVPGNGSLLTSYARKVVWVSWATNLSLHFNVALPGKPSRAHMEWTNWEKVSSVYMDSEWQERGKPEFSLRYRVRLDTD